MSDVAIRVEDVWKSFRVYQERTHSLKERFVGRHNRYEEFWALKGVTFDVPVGSTLGIIGSNGSGKSTTLKVLAKILTPNKGRVEVNGTIASLLELGTGFHPDLTGRENVYLASAVLGRSEAQTDAIYDSIVDFAGVHDFMDLPVKNYSSGMYARLAFAVSISVEPDVLLLDEVLAVGDEEFQLKCFERIGQLRNSGRTIVLVSHSLDTIQSMTRDAVWIERGDLRAYGPSGDVVAQYLGDVHSRDGVQAAPAAEPTRWGTGAASISAVRLVGADGRATTTLTGGDPVTIEVDYQSSEALAELVVGIALHRADSGQLVHGQSSVRSELGLKLPAAGTVSLAIDELPLLKGPYLLTVALHDATGGVTYDWHEREYGFSVLDTPGTLGQSGTLYIPSRWSVTERLGGAVVGSEPTGVQ